MAKAAVTRSIRDDINFMTESEHNNELLFREVIRFQTEKGADHEKE